MDPRKRDQEKIRRTSEDRPRREHDESIAQAVQDVQEQSQYHSRYTGRNFLRNILVGLRLSRLSRVMTDSC